MTTIQFSPTLDGASQDPETDGGSVTRLVLYPTADRSGSLVADVGPATRIGFGLYEFTLLTEPPPGRYYTAITWRPIDTSEWLTDTTAHVDFPLRTDLLVSAEDVAVTLGLSLPITADQRELLWDAIADAQDAVEGAIGTFWPVTTTATLAAYSTDLFDPATWFAWPDSSTVIVAAVATSDPTVFTVTYRTGLNGATEAPIRRYVKAHAAAYYRATPIGYAIPRRVTSVAAEGQSVSYESDSGAGSRPVTWPDLDALVARYKTRKPKVFQRRGAPLSLPGPTEPAAWRVYDDGPFYYEG